MEENTGKATLKVPSLVDELKQKLHIDAVFFVEYVIKKRGRSHSA